MNQKAATLTSSTDVGAATRADLIAAGRSLFARRGFDGTSVRAITSHAGANLGAVTYHFGSKRALYGAVLEAGLRPVADRVRDAARSGSALDRILRVVEAYFDHFEDNPDLPHLMLQEVTAGKQPPAVVMDIVSGVKTTLVRLHAEGMSDGSVRPGDPLLTALSVIAQPVYFTLIAPLAKAIGGLDLADPDTRSRTLAHVIAFVRAGLDPNQAPTP